MGPLLHSCVEIREVDPIELSFGMVSGVGPGIDVRNGGPCYSRGRDCFLDFWHLCPSFIRMGRSTLFAQKCIRLVCEKLLLETSFHCLSDDVVTFKIELGFRRNMQKCNSCNMQKSCLTAHCSGDINVDDQGCQLIFSAQ